MITITDEEYNKLKANEALIDEIILTLLEEENKLDIYYRSTRQNYYLGGLKEVRNIKEKIKESLLKRGV